MTHPELPAPNNRPPNSSPPVTDHTIPAHAHASEAALHAEDQGYHKGLKPRQIQMIAIGGAIGTGLFLGAGGRLAAAGPSLVIAYAVCGFFAFLILRALGELVLHRPVVGLVRLLRPRILRREGRVRLRLVLLDQLGHDRHRGHHRRRALHELLRASTCALDGRRAAVGLGAGRPGRGPRPEPRLRQGVRRDGILVRADQGRRAGRLPARRHLLRHLRHPRGRPGGRLQPHRRQRRHASPTACCP